MTKSFITSRPDIITLLTLYLLIDFPILIDTLGMELSILYFKG